MVFRETDGVQRRVCQTLAAVVGSQFFQLYQILAPCIPGFADAGNAVPRIDCDFSVRERTAGVVNDYGIVLFVDQFSVFTTRDGIQYLDLAHAHIYLVDAAGNIDLFR